jgi:hypothetical protein
MGAHELRVPAQCVEALPYILDKVHTVAIECEVDIDKHLETGIVYVEFLHDCSIDVDGQCVCAFGLEIAETGPEVLGHEDAVDGEFGYVEGCVGDVEKLYSFEQLECHRGLIAVQWVLTIAIAFFCFLEVLPDKCGAEERDLCGVDDSCKL